MPFLRYPLRQPRRLSKVRYQADPVSGRLRILRQHCSLGNPGRPHRNLGSSIGNVGLPHSSHAARLPRLIRGNRRPASPSNVFAA